MNPSPSRSAAFTTSHATVSITLVAVPKAFYRRGTHKTVENVTMGIKKLATRQTLNNYELVKGPLIVEKE